MGMHLDFLTILPGPLCLQAWGWQGHLWNLTDEISVGSQASTGVRPQ